MMWHVRRPSRHRSTGSARHDAVGAQCVHFGDDPGRQAYDEAVQASLEDALARRAPGQAAAVSLGRPAGLSLIELAARNDDFHRGGVRSTAVRTSRSNYIEAGDAFQIVPSLRLRGRRSTGDAFDVYRSLRLVNPSPFMFFLRGEGSVSIAGSSSPELMSTCARWQGRIRVVPSPGRDRRGADAAEADETLEPRICLPTRRSARST